MFIFLSKLNATVFVLPFYDTTYIISLVCNCMHFFFPSVVASAFFSVRVV